MKITFLGTGTSTGIPEIGCQCEVCTSTDIKNRRLRASVLLDIDDKRLLIDCGPDFREQMLNREFKKIDALLLTHEHYDHVGGLDDLRPFCKMGDIDIYTNSITKEALMRRIPYCFKDYPYPGVPVLNLHEIPSNKAFTAAGIGILPINIMHFKLPIYGYRIGQFAYMTDVKTIPDKEFDKLRDLDVLVMDALQHKEHLSHQTLQKALINIERIAPQKAYLIHMGHRMGLHEEIEKTLPSNVHLAYDGLELII